MCIIDPACPLTECLRYRILQCGCSSLYRMNLCAQESHSVHVESLSDRVLLAHVYLTLHAHHGCNCSCCNTVLSGTGLRDNSCLAHSLGKEHLSDYVVDLVRSCVVQILSLEVDLCTAQILCHSLRIVKSARSSRILVEHLREFSVELRIILIFLVSLLQLQHRIHQSLWNVLAAVNAKSAF